MRVEPTLQALFPEISRLHGGKSIGDVMRRLMWSEAARLGITPAGDHSHRRGHARYTT